MFRLPHLLCAVTLAFSFLNVAGAQSLLPPEPVRLDSLAAFRPTAANWRVAGGLAGDPRRDKILAAADGVGVLINNPRDDARGHLLTTWEHGDLDLDLDFLMAAGSNSGVYLQGRYEVQLFDSWGVREPKYGDCGGIYQRWDATRGQGKEGYEGVAPRANACRAPGLWQHLHIEFRAPRFDAAGKKTANARFVKVVLNDFTIHQNVEVTGPTRSAAFNDEKATGPLMIQGDHGAVALRALMVKRLGPDRVRVDGLGYKLYPGEFKQIGEYEAEKPKSTGVPDRFAPEAVERSGHFAVVFTGSLNAPRAGLYGFTADARDPVRLTIDDRAVVLPLEKGGVPGTVTLTAGAHRFQLDYLHATNGRPALDLMAEGPEMAPQALTPREPRASFGGSQRQILIEPDDHVRLQRSFVPFEPKKHLYAINVGTPAGIHYTYDFETGTLLRVWHGHFLDTADMWDGRGEPQTAKPAGPALTLEAKPTLALLERSANDWPDAPEPLWSSQGYALEPDGQPVFLNKLSTLSVRDRIAPTADGRGLTRTLNLKGKNTSWETWVLLAEADHITAQPDGHGYIIGDRSYYIDLPADSAVRPLVRTRNGRQQLVVPVSSNSIEKPIVYTLVW